MRIVVLGGGISSEREVSLVSATSVCKALRRKGHQAVFVDMFFGLEKYLGRLEAVFSEPDGLCKNASIQEEAPDINRVLETRGLSSKSRLGPGVLDICAMADCVYLGLHGEDGEDGKIQATLELMGIPFTGSGALGSAMAMDKSIAKKIVNCDGVLTPTWKQYSVCEETVQAIADTLSFPCVIKVVNGGSSIGVYMPETMEEAIQALHETIQFGGRIIIEEKIIGREVTVPVFGEKALSPIEIVPPANGKFDYVAKYQSGEKGATEICPARLNTEETSLVQNAALKVHKALGLSVLSRSDFILDEDGRAWFLEVNTLPGMTPNSLLPKAALLEGLDYDSLCEAIVEMSMGITRYN